MPRATFVEEKLLRSRHEELQRITTFETGLLIALQGAKTDTILGFIRTPDAEEGTQATTLSVDWVLEHARQLARMLPGGVVVLGLYVLTSSSRLSVLEQKLYSLLVTLAKQLPDRVLEKQAVLLQLPTDSRKASCRMVTEGAPKLLPVDLKQTQGPAQVLHMGAYP